MPRSPQNTEKAYLTLIPSSPARTDGGIGTQARVDYKQSPCPAPTIPELHKRHRASSLRVTVLVKNLTNQVSASQLALDREISDEMQKTAQIERRISDQAGTIEDAGHKLEIALSYSDDSEIAWRLVRSAYQDLCRK